MKNLLLVISVLFVAVASTTSAEAQTLDCYTGRADLKYGTPDKFFQFKSGQFQFTGDVTVCFNDLEGVLSINGSGNSTIDDSTYTLSAKFGGAVEDSSNPGKYNFTTLLQETFIVSTVTGSVPVIVESKQNEEGSYVFLDTNFEAGPSILTVVEAWNMVNGDVNDLSVQNMTMLSSLELHSVQPTSIITLDTERIRISELEQQVSELETKLAKCDDKYKSLLRKYNIWRRATFRYRALWIRLLRSQG